MAALKVYGAFILGCVLHVIGAYFMLLVVAALAVAVSLFGGHPAAVLIAVPVGLAAIVLVLGGPGYLAARIGGGGEWMGLAVGLVGAAFWLSAPIVLSGASTELMHELPGQAAFYAVVLGVPPALGG